MNIIVLLLPLFLFPVLIISFIVVVVLFAKAKGNIKNMSKKQRVLGIFLAVLPLLFLGLMFLPLLTQTESSVEEFQKFKEEEAQTRLDGIMRGEIKVYEVRDIVDPTQTQKISVTGSDIIPGFSFDIFKQDLSLVATKKDNNSIDTSILIKNTQFENVEQLRDSGVGTIRFYKPQLSKDEVESNFQRSNINYIKKEIDTGTVFESEVSLFGSSLDAPVASGKSGYFEYVLYFNNIDLAMSISIRYLDKSDDASRYLVVVSREYAKELYTLIVSTLKINTVLN